MEGKRILALLATVALVGGIYGLWWLKGAVPFRDNLSSEVERLREADARAEELEQEISSIREEIKSYDKFLPTEETLAEYITRIKTAVRNNATLVAFSLQSLPSPAGQMLRQRKISVTFEAGSYEKIMAFLSRIEAFERIFVPRKVNMEWVRNSGKIRVSCDLISFVRVKGGEK